MKMQEKYKICCKICKIPIFTSMKNKRRFKKTFKKSKKAKRKKSIWKIRKNEDKKCVRFLYKMKR